MTEQGKAPSAQVFASASPFWIACVNCAWTSRDAEEKHDCPRHPDRLDATIKMLADALELALDDDGMSCDAVEDCGCWSSLARAALRAAGRLGSAAIAAEPPQKALELPPLPPPSDSKG